MLKHLIYHLLFAAFFRFHMGMIDVFHIYYDKFDLIFMVSYTSVAF